MKLRQSQNGRYCADDIFKLIFDNKDRIVIQIEPKFTLRSIRD